MTYDIYLRRPGRTNRWHRLAAPVMANSRSDALRRALGVTVPPRAIIAADPAGYLYTAEPASRPL